MRAYEEIQQEIKALIRFYDRRGWDWTAAAEFTLRKYSGTWPHSCWQNVNRKGAPRIKSGPVASRSKRAKR